MASEDLSIVGIEATSREEAHDLADSIDELAKEGTVTVREVAVVHKNKHDRTKVHYITDHGAGIGAVAGAGLGAWNLASGAVAGTGLSIATGGVLPVIVGSALGLGIMAGGGAAVGKAFDMHHEAGKKVLRRLSEHVEAGHAVTFAVVDPANADTLADAFGDHEVHTSTISGEDQEKIAAELRDE